MKRLCVVALLLLAGGCDVLKTKSAETPSFYSLNSEPTVALPASRAPAAAPTLIVNPPHAAAGFDSRRIIYLRQAHKLEYFAHSEWVDTPARMLAPLIVAGLENRGLFRAVVLTPSAATGDLRLDTEIIRLQHEFGTKPSSVRFTLHAYLVEVKSRRVLAWQELEAIVPSESDNPYGGVLAANRAVQAVLERLAAFCTETLAKPR